MHIETTAYDEQKEKKKGGATIGSGSRLKQFYDKGNIAKGRYDKANTTRNKVQQGFRWFKSDKVHPVSQTTTNMIPQSAIAPAV